MKSISSLKTFAFSISKTFQDSQLILIITKKKIQFISAASIPASLFTKNSFRSLFRRLPPLFPADFHRDSTRATQVVGWCLAQTKSSLPKTCWLSQYCANQVSGGGGSGSRNSNFITISTKNRESQIWKVELGLIWRWGRVKLSDWY